MKKFLMIAAMAMVATVACTKDETPDGPTPGAPEVSVVAAPASVGVGANGMLTATLTVASTEEVIVTVNNPNADFLTLAGTEIKIEAGKLTGNLSYTGKAKGTAVLAITSTGATVTTASVTVTVTEEGPVEPEYDFPTAAWGTYFGMSKAVIGTTTLTASCADGDGADKPLMGNDDFGLGYVTDDLTGTIVPLTEGMAFTIYADNFTSTADKYDVFFYIDWNKDGKFDEATELVKVQKGISGATKTEITGTITIPATAAAGTRARIIVANEENDIADGVNDMDSGYLMDFSVSK